MQFQDRNDILNKILLEYQGRHECKLMYLDLPSYQATLFQPLHFVFDLQGSLVLIGNNPGDCFGLLKRLLCSDQTAILFFLLAYRLCYKRKRSNYANQPLRPAEAIQRHRYRAFDVSSRAVWQPLHILSPAGSQL